MESPAAALLRLITAYDFGDRTFSGVSDMPPPSSPICPTALRGDAGQHVVCSTFRLTNSKGQNPGYLIGGPKAIAVTPTGLVPAASAVMYLAGCGLPLAVNSAGVNSAIEPVQSLPG